MRSNILYCFETPAIRKAVVQKRDEVQQKKKNIMNW
jgi:hypothetical protein